MAAGRSVRLYLVDGMSSGILTAEIMNWTGHVLSSPRTRLDGALAREELKRTGVYILYGPDDEGSDLPKAYVGESDDISKRLYSHNKDESKNFWEKFVAITSKDLNLTKAHVKYLEARLLELLQKAKKSKLANRDLPKFDRLPEADIADMESFLSEIELVLPVVGIDFLRKPQIKIKGFSSTSVDMKQQEEADTPVIFRLKNKNAGIDGTAIEIDGEFVLQAGSEGSLKERASFNERNKIAREEAFDTGRAKKIGPSNFRVVEDIAFTSPSAASVFLFGTSRNGRTDWTVESSSQSYGDWKDQLIELPV